MVREALCQARIKVWPVRVRGQLTFDNYIVKQWNISKVVGFSVISYIMCYEGINSDESVAPTVWSIIVFLIRP